MAYTGCALVAWEPSMSKQLRHLPEAWTTSMGNLGVQRRQRGQVIPMTLIFIASVLLSLWVMYDSGRVMTEKIKLQNTADNVAYSAAALISRDLNFIAYTNRAMIANQVAIGQMVGLSSWAAMMERLGINLDYLGSLVSWIPYIGQIIKSVTQAVKTATEALATATDAAAEPIIALNDQLTVGMAMAQQMFHVQMMGTIPPFTSQIAQDNDPEAQAVAAGLAGMANLVNEMAQNIERYENPGKYSSLRTRQRYAEFYEIVNQSRDPFTTERSYSMDFPLSGSIGLVSWETKKRGGSDLVRSEAPGGEYQWDWTAMDTMGFEVIFDLPWPLDEFELDLPLAWGAAHALDDDGPYFDYSSHRGYGNAWIDTTNESWLAFAEHSQHEVGNIEGLQPFYAFRDEEQAHIYGPGYIAFYRKSAADMNLMDDDSDTEDVLDTGSADSSITAAAKARPYFARPTDIEQFARLDGNFEYGNLYNPFWQPRLVELSNAEKAALMAASQF